GAQAIPGPIDITAALFRRIAHGDELNIRIGQNRRHLSQSLRAATDLRDRNFLARRDKSRSAQNVSRHDAKDCGSRAATEHEVAPGKSLLIRALDSFHSSLAEPMELR